MAQSHGMRLRALERQMRCLRQSIIGLDTVILDDQKAQCRIRKVSAQRKQEGGSINMIELMRKTHLPGAQIERIMDQLENKGVVKEL